MAGQRCGWCRKTFVAQRSHARYCSTACRTAAGRQRRDDQPTHPAGKARGSAQTRALNKAVKAATWLTPQDAAAVALARLYARSIDATPDQAKTLGPEYLRVLDQLGLTTRSRTAASIGIDPAPSTVARKLDELRARRERRTTPRQEV